MPTYRYRCSSCGEQFEQWQSIHDEPLREHTGCGGPVTKVMAPAGIVLKGSGFYRNDSRSRSTGGEKKKVDASANGSGSESPKSDGASNGSKDSSKPSSDSTTKSGSTP